MYGLRGALLLGGLTGIIAAAALECGSPVAPPNWGVGSDRLNKTQTRPADSGIAVVDGDVRLVDGSADGALQRYLDSSMPLAP